MTVGPRSKLSRLDRAYRLASRKHGRNFDMLMAARSAVCVDSQFQFFQDYLEALDDLLRSVKLLHAHSARAGKRAARAAGQADC